MKTYFTYEGQIGSKEVAEAIAFPVGLGPFMGFGSAQVTNTSITLSARSPGELATTKPSPYYKDINDRVLARRVTLRGESALPSFGLINRSGHIWVSTQPNLVIDNIRGSKGAWNEVLVFAVFQDVQEPINNMPTLVAYWNSSQQSFYEYWKQSIDQDYGKTENTSLDIDPWQSSHISFEDLEKKVIAAAGDWYNSSNTAVLIGIYGTGTNVDTNDNEDFALVPYGGVFPQSLPFTPDYYFKLKRVLSYLNDFVLNGLTGYTSLKAYIDYRLGDTEGTKETKEVLGTIPIGGIIAWYGTSVPEGWAICDGNQGTPNLTGKFIRGGGGGFKPGDKGGQDEVTLTTAHMPKHRHGGIPLLRNGKGDNKSNNTTWAMALYQNQDALNGGYTDYEGSNNPTPVPTLPPYFTLLYIMLIL